MTEPDPRERQVAEARDAGCHDEALRLLRQLFADNDAAGRPSQSLNFFTMFTWKLMVDAYPPARAAMAAARDEQVARMFAGDPQYGRDDRTPGDDLRDWPWRPSRFSMAVEMNETLGDVQSTYQVFMRLDREQPEYARRHGAWRALPAIVACRDFALAERHLPEPLRMLDEVNTGARSRPLFPPAGEAPRVAGDLMNLMRDVHIVLAVLEGTGRQDEAAVLRADLLERLASVELRELAQRDLERPGAVLQAIVAHQMALWPQAGAGG